MNKKKKIAIIVTILSLVILAFPFPVPCRVSGMTCTTAPNENSEITRNGDIEPFVSVLIETVTRQDFFLKYSTYEITEKISQ